MHCLLITVRFAIEFRVGAPLKSTRHLYKPLSVKATSRINKKLFFPDLASFSLTMWKTALPPPKLWESVQCLTASGPDPLKS